MEAKPKAALAASAAVLLAGSLAAEGQNKAQVSITGRVRPAYSLEVVATTSDVNHEVLLLPQERDRVLVAVRRWSGEATPSGVITLLFTLRTNAGSYQLQAAQLTGASPVPADVGTPQPSGDGSRVAIMASSALSVPTSGC